MATAKNYILTFVGKSGRTYQISGYTADTASSSNTFSPNGLAVFGGLQYWRAPEDVVMRDLSIPTGTTQTSGIMQQDGATRAGSLLDYVASVSTNPQRPVYNISFPAGSLIGAMTL